MLEGVAEDAELGTLFYAVATGEEAARALVGRIEDAHPHLELELHSGGPDLYPYLLIVE